jgi:hypothetical protein
MASSLCVSSIFRLIAITGDTGCARLAG